MGGGTQLLLGAHLTSANMRFCRELGKCRDHITGTTGGARGEKICHVEKFLHMTYCYLKRFST